MIGHRLALAGAVLAALTLAGCGDSSDQADSAAPPPVATTSPTPVAEPAPAVAPAAPAAIAIATPAATEPVAAAVPAPSVAAALPGAAAAPPVTEPAAAPATAAVAPAPSVAIAATPPATQETTAVPAGPAAAPFPPPELAVLVTPPAEPAAAPAPQEATLEQRIAAGNPAEGAVYLMQCEICHTVDQGGAARIGPNLFSVVNAPVGRDPAFAYSPAFQALKAEGATWTPERLDAFLAAPGAAVPGTRMGFGGFSDPDTRADVIAWLATLVPVAADAAAAPQIVGVQMPGLGPVSFVAVQADVGADQYVRLGCGSCHGADMRGGVASALVGPEFEARWFVRPMLDFITALKTMPPNEPGTLSDNRYFELASAILAANGFDAGAAPLRGNAATLQAIGFYQPVPLANGRNR